ncbi:hypothetical protein [Nitratifractor sp.]|uniref:hypothetical protein n=1 Tax=Nitratifractor sp. TaxID=2268144 RepID=UPI0025D806E6|nr:hypothetical protein [Nitratifractor sp.]
MARKFKSWDHLYDERTLKIGIRLYQEGELPLEFLYRLMSARRLKSFSIIVIHSPVEGFGEFLKQQKRKTDLLFELDKENEVYVFFCQETKVEGGYLFLKRLIRTGQEEFPEIYASIVGIESTQYPIRDLVFIVLDGFVKTIDAETEEGRVLYRTVR